MAPWRFKAAPRGTDRVPRTPGPRRSLVPPTVLAVSERYSPRRVVSDRRETQGPRLRTRRPPLIEPEADVLARFTRCARLIGFNSAADSCGSRRCSPQECTVRESREHSERDVGRGTTGGSLPSEARQTLTDGVSRKCTVRELNRRKTFRGCGLASLDRSGLRLPGFNSVR